MSFKTNLLLKSRSSHEICVPCRVKIVSLFLEVLLLIIHFCIFPIAVVAKLLISHPRCSSHIKHITVLNSKTYFKLAWLRFGLKHFVSNFYFDHTHEVQNLQKHISEFCCKVSWECLYSNFSYYLENIIQVT